jgi:hypothetical protein
MKELSYQAAAMGGDAVIRVDKQSNCRMVVVDPERTSVKENDERVKAISKPAEYETVCDTNTEYTIIRFMDV